jgi:hypothetical protein
LQAKARDIRGHLSDAVQQLPSGAPAAIHVGLETVDGPTVEEERNRRIFGTVTRFSPHGKDLKWVYCHLFQSYSPPENKPWFIDETIYYFTDGLTPDPLPHHGLIVPDDIPHMDGVHWHRDAP